MSFYFLEICFKNCLVGFSDFGGKCLSLVIENLSDMCRYVFPHVITQQSTALQRICLQGSLKVLRKITNTASKKTALIWDNKARLKR